MTPRQAALALAATALLWSIGGVFIKLVDWNPGAIAGARSGIAALFMLLLLKRPRLNLFMPEYTPQGLVRRINWPLVGAALSTATCMLLFVLATRLTTAANAVVLQYLAPVHVALLAPRMLGEPTRARDWLALALALAGMALFFWGDVSAQGKLGIVLALGSSVAFAGMPLFLRKMGDSGQTEAVLLGNALLSLCCIPFYLQGPPPDLTSWGGLVLLGTLQLGLPYLLYTRAVRHVSALAATIIPVIEPIFNPVWVFLFLGEHPAGTALAGGAIVLGAATLQGVLAARGK